MPDRVPTFSELPVVPDAPPRSAWGVFGRDDQLLLSDADTPGCLHGQPLALGASSVGTASTS